jgi:hypothetical protein
LGELLLDRAEVVHVRDQAAGVAEHVLGAQEQPGASVPPAGKDEAGGEVARGLQSGVATEVPTASGDRVHAGGNALPQGGFAAAVLANQEGDRGGEGEFGQVADERQRPGEARRVDRDVRPAAEGRQQEHRWSFL